MRTWATGCYGNGAEGTRTPDLRIAKPLQLHAEKPKSPCLDASYTNRSDSQIVAFCRVSSRCIAVSAAQSGCQHGTAPRGGVRGREPEVTATDSVRSRHLGDVGARPTGRGFDVVCRSPGTRTPDCPATCRAIGNSTTRHTRRIGFATAARQLRPLRNGAHTRDESSARGATQLDWCYLPPDAPGNLPATRSATFSVIFLHFGACLLLLVRATCISPLFGSKTALL